MEEWAALAGELLRRDHMVRLRVRGWSMHPAISDGEVVRIAPENPDRLRPGYIVLYVRDGGRPVIHRVIRRRRQAGEGWCCVGADRFPDQWEWVSPGQMLGRVVAVERAGRQISLVGWSGEAWAWIFMLLRPLRPLLARLRRGARRMGLSRGPADGRPTAAVEDSPGDI